MAKKVIIVGDVHWESRDEEAVSVATAAIRTFKPDIIVNLGDLVDASPFSRHTRAKVSETDTKDWAEEELAPSIDWCIETAKHCGEYHFVEGNHDAWLERWCANIGTGGRSLYSMVSPRKQLEKAFRERFKGKFKFYPWINEHMRRGSYVDLHKRLIAVHGWSTSKYAANSHLTMSKTRSIVYGHAHRQETRVIRNPYTDEKIEAIGNGCLCNLRPMYLHGSSPSEWVHGFTVGFLGKRDYQLYPVTIERGAAIMPCGKEIKA